MQADIARALVERYFLEPDETIVAVSEHDSGLVVATRDWEWHVAPVERWPHFRKSEGYRLYEVRSGLIVDPPRRPDGVAVLPDGRMFHLGNEDGLREFFRRAGENVSQLELAGLLARYQGDAPHLDRLQNLIVDENDLTGLLEAEQVAAIPDFLPFKSTGRAGGRWTVDFCTYYVDQEPPDYTFRIGLNRWHVEADEHGWLEWAAWPIARGLPSPFYSPP